MSGPIIPFQSPRRRLHAYEQRVVAFVDVLGLSATLSNPLKAGRYAQALAAILSPIVRSRDESWLVLPHVDTGEEIEIQLAPPPARGARTTVVSDSILITVPLPAPPLKTHRVNSVFSCLQAIYWLQRSLLVLGVRTRGGITSGGLIHKNHLVVGEGLVKAYQIESRRAIYPRTVIDPELIDVLIGGPIPEVALFRNRVAHMVRQDQDGAYFVDYLSWDPVMGECNFREHSKRIFAELSADIMASDGRVREKLVWLQRYLVTAQRSLNIYDGPVKDHADDRFSSVYFRTNDNLLTWVDEYILTRRAPAGPVRGPER